MASVVSLFESRLRKEGRWDEYQAACDAERTKRGKGGVCWNVMRAFGYESADVERGLARVEAKGKRAPDLQEAITTLPPNAPAAVELAWIRAHPAMARESSGAGVVITTDDVLHTEAGPAPSRAAVYGLQHWTNNKTEFFKQMLGVQKKETETKDAKGESAARVAVEEIHEMLAAHRAEAIRCPYCGKEIA